MDDPGCAPAGPSRRVTGALRGDSQRRELREEGIDTDLPSHWCWLVLGFPEGHYLEAQTLGLNKKVGRDGKRAKGCLDFLLEAAEDKELILQSRGSGNAQGARERRRPSN